MIKVKERLCEESWARRDEEKLDSRPRERCVTAASWCVDSDSEAACRKSLTSQSGGKKHIERVVRLVLILMRKMTAPRAALAHTFNLSLDLEGVTGPKPWRQILRRDIGRRQRWQIFHLSKSTPPLFTLQTSTIIRPYACGHQLDLSLHQQRANSLKCLAWFRNRIIHLHDKITGMFLF